MSIDSLRPGWPPDLLVGQYTLHRGWSDGMVNLMEPFAGGGPARDTLEIRVAGRPVLYVARGLRNDVGVCTTAPPAVVLHLRWRNKADVSFLRFLFLDSAYDVIDTRLGVAVGTVVVRNGLRWFWRGDRIDIVDPAGRARGYLVERTWIRRWLPYFTSRYEFVAGGVAIARMRQVFRPLARTFRVDVAGAADRLDPHLMLVCACLAAMAKVRNHDQ